MLAPIGYVATMDQAKPVCKFTPIHKVALQKAIIDYNNTNPDLRGPIGTWCLNKVKDLSNLFFYMDSFNEDISEWDVSTVVNMKLMFSNARSFNQPIGVWNVSSLTNMAYMFNRATSFNQPVGLWDVSSVTQMEGMFNAADSFNQPIGTWDVSSVTNMNSLLGALETFNQPLNDWDTSSVTTMQSMFSGSSSFNQPIDKWDVSSVSDMSYMFNRAKLFNQPLSSWDVSSVTNMRYMFYANSFEDSFFNQPLADWDVSSVKSMRQMFAGTSFYNQPLGSWNVSSVTNMSEMFRDAISFNQPLNLWNVSSVTDMENMFNNAISFNQPLDLWNISSVTDMDRMFEDASSFQQNLCSWSHQLLRRTSTTSIFQGTKCDFKIDVKGIFFCTRCLRLIPPSSTSTPSCFSGQSQVQIKGKGPIRMDALKIGDMVLTNNGIYSMVFSFGHYSPNIDTDFVQIQTNNSDVPLEISAEHMLYVNGKLAPARQVQIDDILISIGGKNDILQVGVTSIGMISRHGAFAPLTGTGEIVVNRIVASNYVAREWISYHKWFTPLSTEMLHWLQHLAIQPYRAFCAMKLSGCKDETYDNEGFSKCVGFWFHVERWVLGSSPLWRAAFMWIIVSPIAMVAVMGGKMITSTLSVFDLVAVLLVVCILKKQVHQYFSQQSSDMRVRLRGMKHFTIKSTRQK